MPVDYDSPRASSDEIETQSIEAMQVARARVASQRTPDRHPEDDVPEMETFELPGADLSGESLVVEVRPQQANEFTCTSCFLVRHRSQLADPARGLCVDCA